MTGSIRQIQLIYNAEEDRVLFRLNSTSNQQFRFWFTRRFCMLLLKVLKDHFDKDPDLSLQEDPQARQAISEFKREKAISNANFKEQFQEEEDVQMPLGDVIPVAYKLTFNINKGVMNLGVQPKEGQGITLGVSQEINSSMTQLLLTAARKGDWRLEPAAGGAVVETPQQKVIN